VTNRKVLVVDDDALARVMVSDALRTLGWEPVACGSAADALVSLRRECPAACIVDNVMPRVTGAQLIRVLRSSADPKVRALPVIGVSGTGTRELLDSGATLCLEKPVTGFMLRSALRTCAAA
jgi:CheY-like chemotaxis protein